MAANPYPVAYKPAAAVHPQPAPGTFKPKPLPHLGKIPKLPIPANLNVVARFGAGAIARKLPYVGLAIAAYDIYRHFTASQPGTLQLGNWTQSTCAGGDETHQSSYSSHAGCSGAITLATGVTPGPSMPLTDPGPSQVMIRTWHIDVPMPGGDAWVNAFRYDRGAEYQEGYPFVSPDIAFQPAPSPVIRPWLNPEAMPIDQPALVPAPAPGKGLAPGPGQEPGADASAKPTPGAKPNPNPKPEVTTFPAWSPSAPPVWAAPPQAAPAPGAAPQPFVPPVQVVTSPPQPGMKPPVAQARGSSPSNRPPRGSKTHEAKVRQKNLLNKIHAGTLVVVNVATESFDFIDSLYKALPKKRSDTKAEFCDNHDYACKMEKLWKYRDEIDFAKAWQEYVNNQAEDMVFGVMGGQLGKAGHNLGNTTGLNRAIQQNQYGEAPHGLDEVSQDVKNDTGLEDDKTGLLPTLTYDRDTGEWGVAWELFGLDSPDIFIPEVKVKR